VRTDRSFTPDVASIRAARRFVLDTVRQARPEVRDAISVMVSELAMNAVQYARTAFGVRVELEGGRLRVEVTDSGGGNPAIRPLPPASSARGRGLFIVEQLSDEWGVSQGRDGPRRSVWFRIAVTGAVSAQGMRS
jgi:anti-sigma regulatory factor (Ser/Thr protein kinase)